MSIYNQPHGTAYTRDPDYAEFLGKPYRAAIYDWSIRRYRWVVMQAPKTPKDAVTPADADAQLDYEPWERETAPAKEYGPRRETKGLMERIAALLADKPLMIPEIAEATGETWQRIKSHVINYDHLYQVVAHGLAGNLYGLAGKEYEESKYTPTMYRIVQYLREHGPSTAQDIRVALNIHVDTWHAAKRKNPGVLHIVGTKKRNAGKGRDFQLYGLVGIHDTQEAT